MAEKERGSPKKPAGKKPASRKAAPKKAASRKTRAKKAPASQAPAEQQPRSEAPEDRPEAEIAIKGLTKSFGDQVVWEDVTVDIPKKRITVMLGPSGTGKSVLLKHLVGLLKPDRGEIWIDDMNLPSLREKDLYAVRRKFGVLFQDGALFGSMSVYDNVAFPLREHTKTSERDIRGIVTEKLEMVGLRGAEEKLPGEISGGMKKRAGLARAMALDPQVLFYDEPSAGLDPVTSAEIDQLILALTKKIGVTSVVVTHEMDSAFTVGDRMAMLDKGRLIAIETRERFESWRDTPKDQVSSLTIQEQLVRQFLRGDPEGPLSRRRAAKSYEDDLLGVTTYRESTPSVEPTR